MKSKLKITIAGGVMALLFACQPEEADDPARVAFQPNITKVASVAIIEPSERITDLFAEKSGIVAAVLLGINASFEEGDVIMQLKNPLEKTQLAQAQAKYTSQLESIPIYRSDVDIAETKFKQAKADYQRGKALEAGKALSGEFFEDLDFDFNIRQLELHKAKAELQQQLVKLDELRTEVSYYQELLAQTTVFAPFSGRVMTMNLKVGNTVSSASSIGQFLPNGPLIAIAEIDELYASKIEEGMRAYVRTQGMTDTLQFGKVVALAPGLKKKSLFSDNATNLEDRRIREVHVELANKENLLVGSKVECIILLDNKSESLSQTKN